MRVEPPGDVSITTAQPADRARLVPILDESFEGLYLWHAKRTLRSIEVVRVLRVGGEDAGLSMLKSVAEGAGYVYYIAVRRSFRRRGLGGLLLDDALAYFGEAGAAEVFASVEEDNVESNALFSSRGFERTDRGTVANRYGRIRSLVMYREMMVVYGEVLLHKDLGPTPQRTLD